MPSAQMVWGLLLATLIYIIRVCRRFLLYLYITLTTNEQTCHACSFLCRDDGVGLAAPQVGVNVRLMVFNQYGRDKPGNEVILVNPEIVETSVVKVTDEEGCLSFPKIYGDVEVCNFYASMHAHAAGPCTPDVVMCILRALLYYMLQQRLACLTHL